MVLSSERAASQNELGKSLHQSGATQISQQPQAEPNLPGSPRSTAHARTQHLASEYRWSHYSIDWYIPEEGNRIHLKSHMKVLSLRIQMSHPKQQQRIRRPRPGAENLPHNCFPWHKSKVLLSVCESQRLVALG